MRSSLLSHRELLELHHAAITVGLATPGARLALLTAINRAFIASIPVEFAPDLQLMADLQAMSVVGLLTDGSIPLATWLANAEHLASPYAEVEVFRGVSARLRMQEAERIDGNIGAGRGDRASGSSTATTDVLHGQVAAALLSAFPGATGLGRMLRSRLGKDLDIVAAGQDRHKIAAALVASADNEGWLCRLVACAHDSNPGDPRLLTVAQRFGAVPSTPAEPKLTKLLSASQSVGSPDAWLATLGTIAPCICRVEIHAAGVERFGTAFLVAPDVAITNHHVVEPVIRGAVAARDVVLRFDHRRLSDGTVLQGAVFRLAAPDWLLDASPPSPIDFELDPKSGVPAPDELDYALLRVAGEPGHRPVGETHEPGAPARGWIAIDPLGPSMRARAPFVILQHPHSAPLELAVDIGGAMGSNLNGTRVRYAAGTRRGASGSPCFDLDWRLVALHHSGDPAWSPRYTEGIPFVAIATLLTRRGVLGSLGGRKP